MIEVGRFCICGDWDVTPTPADKIRIAMPPAGHVFGCGWHESTRAALLALPGVISPGCSFAEIGAGTAILSIAAKKLGAGTCYATEINPEAWEVAERAIAVNGVAVEFIRGTSIHEKVDVMMVCTGETIARSILEELDAVRILVVTDDARVEDWTDGP